MIVIALGANLPSPAGAPRQTLSAALDQLSRQRIRIAALSPFYRTPAWPDPADPAYVNAVARIETDYSPTELMALLHRTEEHFGRMRMAKNAPRTLDLDLIDYEGRIETGPPVLPHPRLAERAFVLVPFAQIAHDWRHPATGMSIADLLAALPRDAKPIEKI